MITVRFPQGGGFVARQLPDGEYELGVFLYEDSTQADTSIIVSRKNLHVLVEDAESRGFEVENDENTLSHQTS